MRSLLGELFDSAENSMLDTYWTHVRFTIQIDRPPKQL